MEKHRYTLLALKPHAGRTYEGLSETEQIALNSKLMDPVERRQSSQEKMDQQAVERAENEGMVFSPSTSSRPASDDDPRHERQPASLTARTKIAEDVQKEGL